ncbi:MAG: MmgE/PrpD family protein [Rubrivivax sp.]
MSTVATRLAKAVVEAGRAPVAPQHLHEAKRLLLDSLACALGAVDSHVVAGVRAWAAEVAGRADVTLLGTQERSSAFGATIVAATMIRELDLNDTYWSGDSPAHPSDNIGACIAVAQAVGAGTPELLRAILIAVEVHMRLTEASDGAWYKRRGWDLTNFLPIASAAGAGVLLQLDEARMANALAIAGCNAALGQTRVGHISTMKSVTSGRLVAHGVEAAYLAQKGITGPEEIFEGARGWASLMLGDTDWERVTQPMGAWRIAKTCLKQYPAAYIIHNAIDAALELRALHELTAERIAGVTVHCYKWLHEEMVEGGGGKSRYDIDVRETADHSLPYCVAVALVDGEYTLDQLETPRWESAEVKAMLARLQCVHDPALDGGFPAQRPVRVVITTTDGRRLELTTPYPKGDPRKPLSDGEIADKFRRLTRRTLPRERQEILVRTVLELERHTWDDVLQAAAR